MLFHKLATIGLLTALASDVIRAQDTSYEIGFAAGTMCAEVHERAQREGRPPRAWDSFDLSKSLREGVPTVRYSCDGKAQVRTQSVEVEFDNWEEALDDYAKYAQQLRPGLGKPCWDSGALSEAQRKSLQESDHFFAQRYQHRTEWHAAATNTVLTLTSRRGDLSQPPWSVYILTVDARIRPDDMGDEERKVRAWGTCDPVVQLPSVSAIDDAPTILTKWFAHVREKGARFRTPDGLIRYSQVEILGTVPEGDVTDVIARMQVETADGPITAVQSFAFKRSGQRLEMLLPTELQTLELSFRLLTHMLAGAP